MLFLKLKIGKMIHFKESLKKKIVDANKELAAVKYNFKTN
jgi:5-(carboxyamino)imidazole ribonucleotide mutase